MSDTRNRGVVAYNFEAGSLAISNGASEDIVTTTTMRVMEIYNPSDGSITVDFADTALVAHQQIIPPASSHAFGVNYRNQRFDVTFTCTNNGASPTTIIWNATTVEEAI
jgi:hypothetical protein